MKENKTILTDYFYTNGADFCPIVEDEIFFSLQGKDVYTAYLKMRMDKIYKKKKLNEIDELVMELNYINEHRKEIVKRKRESNLTAKKYQLATFNNYMETEQNKALLKLLQDYFENSYKNVNLGYGMYIWGAPGTGKTHALYTLANEFVREGSHDIYFTSFVELFDLLRKNFTDIYVQEELKDRLKKVDILFLDDIGAEHIKKDSEWYQGIIYEVINYRYEHEKPVICTSNSSRANLVKEQNYEERVVQRLMEMCPYQFEFNGDDVMRITRAKQKRMAGEKLVVDLDESNENKFAMFTPPFWASDFYAFEEEYRSKRDASANE